MRVVPALLLAALLVGCAFVEPPYVTFAEVSAPYLESYGPPEEVSTYEAADGNYTSIHWWWYTRGFEVSFLETEYDNVNGWTVDSTYTFDPIL